MQSPSLTPARASFHHSHSTVTKLFDEVRAILDAGWETGELDTSLIKELDEFSARLGAYVLLHIEQEEWKVFPKLQAFGGSVVEEGIQQAVREHRELEQKLLEWRRLLVDGPDELGGKRWLDKLDVMLAGIRRLFVRHTATEHDVFHSEEDEQ